MKSQKGKDGVAGASGTPASRSVQRVSNGLRRPGRTGATRPDLPLATGAGGRLKERLRARLYDLLAAEFTAYAKRSPTRKRLAAQLGQTPEEIGRWLAGPGALAGDAGGLLAPASAAKPARRASRSRKDAAPPEAPAAAPVAAVPPAPLTTGTTIAIGATMVGPGIAALASVDVNPVAQVEVV
jgi:hypothetical protein